MAGATKVPRRAFLIYDALGSLLWVSAGLAIGWVFADAGELVLNTLAILGHWGMLLLAGVLARKAWGRFNSRPEASVVRLSVEELSAMIKSGQGMLLLDVRQKRL